MADYISRKSMKLATEILRIAAEIGKMKKGCRDKRKKILEEAEQKLMFVAFLMDNL